MSRYWQKNLRFAEYLESLKGRGSLLIVAHDNPDPDCMASALLLKKLYEDVLKEPAAIAYGGVIGRAENRAMANALRIPMIKMAEVNFDKYGVVAMIDTQPGTGNNSYPKGRKVDILIDHHPKRKDLPEIEWIDVRTQYGATATIVYEYFVARGLELDRRLATALFYAIKSETQDLGREGITSDRRAYLTSLKLIDPTTIFEIIHAPVSKEYFKLLFYALQNAKIYGDALITNLLDIENPELVAEVADMLLRIEGINWTFVMGRYDGMVFVSLRSLERDVHAGEIIQRVLHGLGTGGGHELVAGGRIPDVRGDADYLRSLEDALTKIFLRQVKVKCKEGDLLVPDNAAQSSSDSVPSSETIEKTIAEVLQKK